jgi:hypothetical protein
MFDRWLIYPMTKLKVLVLSFPDFVDIPNFSFQNQIFTKLVEFLITKNYSKFNISCTLGLNIMNATLQCIPTHWGLFNGTNISCSNSNINFDFARIYILPTYMFVFLTYTSSILLRLMPQILFQTCPMFLKRKLCKMVHLPTCALFSQTSKISDLHLGEWIFITFEALIKYFHK